MNNPARLMLGDCIERMGEIGDGSVDAIICDPPYPEIDRPYGRMTETEWHSMMDRLVPECRRVLKPTGSAVFILQPNSEKVGRMRPWLFEFQAKWCREWGMVQDAWWWNTSTPPNKHANRSVGLMRPSLKACVWLGNSDCYRNQDEILWTESESNKAERLSARAASYKPYGGIMNRSRCGQAAAERGGVTPFNVLPMARSEAGCGHSAATPSPLADWWTRYISPPHGVVCDPFMGSGTMGLAAIARGRDFIGIERDPGYFAISESRIAAAHSSTPLFAAPSPA